MFLRATNLLSHFSKADQPHRKTSARWRSVLALAAVSAALLGADALSTASAQQSGKDRRIVTIDDADFFGSDYRTVKNVDLDGCKLACLGDNQCRAFTFNTSAGWCFLKSDYGQLQSFGGAIAGRVVEVAQSRPSQEADRKSELTFLNKPQFEAATTYARKVEKNGDPGGRTVEQLRDEAAQALSSRSFSTAESRLMSLLSLAPSDLEAWQGMVVALVQQNPDDWNERVRLRRDAISASINAYLRSVEPNERARSLDLLGTALSNESLWKVAIKSWRASLALNDSTAVRSRYEDAVNKYGFRIVDHQVDSDAAAPRICIILSDTLPKGEDMSPYVSVTGKGSVSVETGDAQVCVDGVQHGERYQVTVRSGLPAADGEVLEKSSDLTVYVRDRSPAVHFLGRAYVLPSGGEPTIPVVSVNTSKVKAEVFRIGDRSLASAIRDDRFLNQISNYGSEQITDEQGEKVWTGTVETENRLNDDVTTAIPFKDLGIEMKPGVYLMTARSELDKDEWGLMATQWFIVSDLGLTSLSAPDGVAVNVRSLNSAEALEGVTVRLVAINNEILGEAKSDSDGLARFAAGLTRGRGGMAPGLVIAETAEGDYSFLDLRKPAFDLSDRGVEGRPAPGPLDVFTWTDRGIYKGGETVHAQAMIRTAKAVSQEGLPLTFKIIRPDGVEHSRQVVQDQGLGGYVLDVPLASGTQQGVWSWEVYADPKGASLSQATFLVEDYQPERVDFALETEAKAFDRQAPTPISLEARFLYGSPASGQSLEGDVIVTPVRSLAARPGYVFGLADSETYPSRDSLPGGLTTDDEGKLSFNVTLPDLQETTALYKGQLVARLVEAGGRYVERRLDLPVTADGPRVGIRPLFESGVDEGGQAEFQVILVDAEGKTIAADGLAWSLSKINRRYQWYRSDGSWSYEPITSVSRVANGKLDLGAGEPGRLALPVEWGRYRLEIQARGDMPTATSVEFSAGWYSADATSETPDYLDVGLDKKTYRAGETAVLRLVSQEGGIALVNVVSGGLISSRTVTVDAGTAEVSLPVTDDWGAGAYVTASLYRPMDLAERRMPSRSVGLTWLQVEPGDRDLDVQLDTPDQILPSTTLDVPLRIANLKAGEEAYVTLAAVDVGILNLTGFEPPAPEDWYFGQRRLGAEMRDLYGQLIDRTVGTLGKVRSGGDGGAMRLNAPPPEEEPLALFSGLIKVDDEGKATVSFDIPAFNGKVRIMAVAWSAKGVGHGVADVEVRAPVVMTSSLPAFLAPGDTSRMQLEIDNVDGAAGSYDLTLSVEGPAALGEGAAEVRQLELEPGKKARVLVPLAAGTETGMATVYAALTAPDGSETVKRMSLPIKDTQPELTRRSLFSLNAGNSVTLDRDLYEGLRPGSVKVTVTAGGAARIDVAGLLDALDRYPYGCTEQTTSRALPLLYLNEVASAAGLGSDPEIRDRVTKAIARVLANQSSNGSFGLWNSYGNDDPWLDAYVADFLTRAKEKGYSVPDLAFTQALDNLENQLSYASDFQNGGEAIAYGLYVLSRNGRASMGDLRYYLDAKLAQFATPLAKAQLAASLSLYGEQARAKTGFDAAIQALDMMPSRNYREDYGTPLRDSAGVLTYVAGSTAALEAEQKEASQIVQQEQEASKSYSTQDMAWLLMAAQELNAKAQATSLSVNGTMSDGRLVWSFDAASLENDGAVIQNQGSSASDLLVSVAGQPVTPEPAGGNDYAIERQLYDLDGNPVDPDAVPVNTRIAVVITVRALSEVPGRLMVVDRIPAGLAIDNPRLVRSGSIAALDWLTSVDQPEHAQFRNDSFEVAINESRMDGSEHSFVYLARAVTPGTYAHPPATVEDMYRPERHAIGETSQFTVLGPVR